VLVGVLFNFMYTPLPKYPPGTDIMLDTTNLLGFNVD